MPSPIFVTLTKQDKDIEDIVNEWQKEGHGVKIAKIRKAIRQFYQVERAEKQKQAEPSGAPKPTGEMIH